MKNFSIWKEGFPYNVCDKLNKNIAVDVVIMSHMFFGCMSLIDLNLIGFFVDANLISGLSLFGECKSLHNLKLNTVVYKIIENECNNLCNYFKKTIDFEHTLILAHENLKCYNNIYQFITKFQLFY